MVMAACAHRARSARVRAERGQAGLLLRFATIVATIWPAASTTPLRRAFWAVPTPCGRDPRMPFSRVGPPHFLREEVTARPKVRLTPAS